MKLSFVVWMTPWKLSVHFWEMRIILKKALTFNVNILIGFILKWIKMDKMDLETDTKT